MVILPVTVPYNLAPWVEEIYFLERQGVYTDHHSISDIRSGIFIRWDASEFAMVYDGKTLDRSFVWGASSYPKTTRFIGSVKAVVLILKPSPFYAGLGSAEVLDQTVYVDDLIPSFQKRVQKARTVTDVLALVYSELFSPATSTTTGSDYRLQPVMHALQSAHTLTDIHVLCRQMGITERSLERKMKALLGLSPKAFQNIARFQTVYRHLLAENPSLTDAAYEHRFSDHSHFTREFKRYAGFLPSKIHRFKPHII